MKTPKVRLIILTIYLLAVIAGIAFMFHVGEKTAFAGLYAMLLTAPWSFVFTLLLLAVSNLFSVQVFDSYITGPAIVILSGLINCGLILRWKNSPNEE
jgi:hypothetical protein